MFNIPEHVLVRLPNWVGDACMALPALELLQSAGITISILGQPWAASLFEAHGWEHVPVGDTLGENRRALLDWRNSLGGRRTAGLILPNSFSSALVFRLAGIAAAGYRTDGRSLVLKWAFDKPSGLHEVAVFHNLACQTLRAWGKSADTGLPPQLGLRLSIRAQHDAQAVLAAAGVDPPYVVLAPIATGKVNGQDKQWPHFGELANALQARRIRVIACPSRAEEALTRAMLPGVVCLPPQTLSTFAALLSGAAAVMANDSGAAHIAAAVGATVLVLHGVTDAGRTGAWSPRAIALGRTGHWPDLRQVLEALPLSDLTSALP